jgi:hypothetical protein
MNRVPPRRTVADRLVQNVNGILFEVENIRGGLHDEQANISSTDKVAIGRAIERIESEAEKLRRLLEGRDELTAAS